MMDGPMIDDQAWHRTLGVQERILLFCLPDVGQRGATTPRPDRCRPRRPTGAVAGPMRWPGNFKHSRRKEAEGNLQGRPPRLMWPRCAPL
jgi:hypothetical protein